MGRPITFLLPLFFCLQSLGQVQSDTSGTKSLRMRIQQSKAAQQLLGNFKKNQDTLFNQKSEDPYVQYEGKIIRKISIEHLHFDRNVIDTSRTFRSFITNTANHLHVDSKVWVIRNNLFIREGQPLNSYRVADNERYLRDLDFILDSRIFVKPIEGSPDSVDLLVVTRDVFSLGGSFVAGGPTKYNSQLQESNLAGCGQRLQFSALYDATRNPRTGYEVFYQKTNVMGSFINASADYSQFATGGNYGTENQTSYYLQLSRLLFMPYTRWAGGVTLSHNQSVNVYSKSDTLFEQYRYNIQDYWLGYSFGHKKKLKEIRENRNRKFIALRTFQQQYTQVPLYYSNPFDKLIYHNRTSVLGQLTFLRQDFYKTRYVLGFGRTEDVPYGYRVSFTSGWEKEQDLQRSYSGVEVYRNIVDRNGAFFTYTFRLASYFYKMHTEDALIYVDFNRFSKIYTLGRFKVRHQSDLGYAHQYNQVLKRPLDINDTNGLTNFKPDSLLGNQRINLRYDAVVFSPWKILGFHIAPTARIELAFLSKVNQQLFQKSNFYSAFSGGFRVRNENLVFNTIEARILYYPKTVENIKSIGFSIQANIRIKYPTTLVSAPATVYN